MGHVPWPRQGVPVIPPQRDSRSEHTWPWPAWLSWLGIIAQSKRSLVRFPVRAHAWVVGLILGWGVYERQLIHVSFLTSVFLSLSPSFPLSLKMINKTFKGNKHTNKHSCLSCPLPQGCVLGPIQQSVVGRKGLYIPVQ